MIHSSVTKLADNKPQSKFPHLILMHRRTLLHHKIRCATHVYKDLFECNFTVNILNICIICQPENQISLRSKISKMRMILGTTKKQPCIMRRQ